MYSYEHGFISRIILERDFAPVEKAQITEEYLNIPEVKAVFRFIRDTFHNSATAGLVPSPEMVVSRFPGFALFNAPDPLPLICQVLRREKIKMEIQQLAGQLQEQAEKDPESALESLRMKTVEIAGYSQNGEDMSMSNALAEIKNEYEIVQNSGGVTGIPWPWEVLNEETQGMHDGEFIVLYGRPKNLKTWVALEVATYAWLMARKRVLYYTKEMPPKQLRKRIAARMADVDYGKFKSGKLQPEAYQRVLTMLENLHDEESVPGSPYLIVTTDRGGGGRGNGGVSWIASKIRELKPDLVIVDGMYLLTDDRTKAKSVDWKNIAHISQDLKGAAQEFNIPLIGVTQANRIADKAKGDDLTELAFSDSMGMDADAVIRVTKRLRIDSESKRKITELELMFPGLREARLDGIVVSGEPGHPFKYIRSIVASEEQAQEKSYGTRRTSEPRPPMNHPGGRIL